jgi:hypothetical protein
LQGAEPPFRLVPADGLLVAEVEIETHDVAHIPVGDPATIRFQALLRQQFDLARAY